MADGLTTHYSWVLPQDHGSDSTWGVKNNGTIAAIDAQVWGNAQASADVKALSNLTAGIPATFSFMNSAASSGQQLRWQWQMDTAAESGSGVTSVGSNLNLLAYDNTGVALSPIIMTVNKSMSPITFGVYQPVVIFNPVVNFASLVNLQAPNSGISPELKFSFNNPTFPTNPLYPPQTIGTINGVWTSGGGGGGSIVIATTTSPIASLAVGPAGSITASPTLAVKTNSGIDPSVILQNSSGVTQGTFGVNIGLGHIYMSIAGANSIFLDASGGFTFTGANAYKSGGGSWAAISDARVKTVEGEYQQGLAAVTALRPVVYRYHTGPARTLVGLVAQEVEEVMPEMVTKGDGQIDGEPVSDLRTLDTTALVFALVNCVKELKAEIDALKAMVG